MVVFVLELASVKFEEGLAEIDLSVEVVVFVDLLGSFTALEFVPDSMVEEFVVLLLLAVVLSLVVVVVLPELAVVLPLVVVVVFDEVLVIYVEESVDEEVSLASVGFSVDSVSVEVFPSSSMSSILLSVKISVSMSLDCSSSVH